MKQTVAFFLFGLAVLAGCHSNETPTGTIDDLSPFAKKFLGMQNMGSNSMAMAGNRTVNMAFRGALSVADSGVPPDSSIVDPGPGGWATCAMVTETLNGDGSTTVVTDYGDGCEEGYDPWKYLMFGKNTVTYHYTSSQSGSRFSYEYMNRYIAEHFGGKYYWDMDNNGTPDTTTWISDGRSVFQGKSSYDTATQEFSGYYTHSDTSTYTQNNESYSYKSVGESTHDSRRLTVTLNNYEFRDGTNYYQSQVVSPLISDFTCFSGVGSAMLVQPFWMVYVAGRERVTYRQDGETGTFEIDYGNGECDGIILIHENGKIIRIDLFKEIGALNLGG